ncbi:MAG: thioredoxin family protein [Bacteroidota bacterium]
MKSSEKILILLFLFGSVNVFSQEINKTKIDEKSQMEVLIGLCNRDGLKSDLFKTYFDTEYAAYTPDDATINSLKASMANKNIRITIVMGSWCGDSQEQVPRFYKIMDQSGFAESNITLYCVDRSKKSDKGETDSLGIQLVPAFIFYQDGKEIGRITETPKTNLEKDFLDIVS